MQRGGAVTEKRDRVVGYFALRLLGYPWVRNYLGSWKEWGDREDLPIEAPAG